MPAPSGSTQEIVDVKGLVEKYCQLDSVIHTKMSEPVFDTSNNVVDTTPVGGSTQLIVNNELIFPLVESLGLRGVLFFDTGNAWKASEGIPLDDLRYDAGWGVRWLSPIGSMSLKKARFATPGLPRNCARMPSCAVTACCRRASACPCCPCAACR